MLVVSRGEDSQVVLRPNDLHRARHDSMSISAPFAVALSSSGATGLLQLACLAVRRRATRFSVTASALGGLPNRSPEGAEAGGPD